MFIGMSMHSELRRCAVAFLGACVAVCVISCNNERKVDVASKLNPRGMPTMSTENVATLISDSGIVQYKLVSPRWLVFNEAKEPYWHFPKGIYLRKYDRAFKVIASVAADSARYLSQKKLWKLDGHVEIHRGTADLFLTSQLFWDEREHKLYSDSFIHIETATHILEGMGFVSNERLTKYTIVKPTGVFPINQQSIEPGVPAPQPPSGQQGATVEERTEITNEENTI